MKFLFLLFYILLNFITIVIYNSLNNQFSITVTAILLFFIMLFFGYILYNFLSEQKFRQDRVLEHIIRETLHEINLPVSTIYANIKMLLKRVDNQKDIIRLKRIEGSLDRLNRLYKNLSYNIKKEIFSIEKEIIDLDLILKERVDFFKYFNRNRFIVNLARLRVEVDKIGLEQVFDNIIENAMKYSSKDSDILIYNIENKVVVEDFGIGIEQDELSLIYQKYYQENSIYSGEGIGLSIVKSFCDSNRINLKIESIKGRGTKVILDFKNLIINENLQQS